jgi:carboxyl-terminal processing protease
MSRRTRLVVLSVTAPVVAFILVGGVLGRVMAREDTYQHLKVFDDVVGWISSSYVEPVDMDKVMLGAMHGLADGLDSDSAYLSPQEVKQLESGTVLPPGDVGLDLMRQYYLRIISARDGSPAARAGLRTGDFIRAIDDHPTREMSVWEGLRALRGAPGTTVRLTIIRGNAADPHPIDLTRETLGPLEVMGHVAAPGVGYLRVGAIGPKTAEQVKKVVADLSKSGAVKLVVDVRRAAGGAFEDGLAMARLFVGQGTLAVLEAKGSEQKTVLAAPGDGSISLPTVLLIDTGTSGAAELFASALWANKRADLIGERTLGRMSVQKVIKLPDGSGLWLSTARYATPSAGSSRERGLEPAVTVDEPESDFGQPAPTNDPALEKAIERLSQKAAA